MMKAIGNIALSAMERDLKSGVPNAEWIINQKKMTETITLEIQPLESIRELQVYEGGRWQRRIGALYFHQLEDGNFVLHLVTDKTNGEWLQKMTNQRRIYVPKQKIQAEPS
jgi:phage-related protein